MQALTCPNCGAAFHETNYGASLRCTFCHQEVERAAAAPPPYGAPQYGAPPPQQYGAQPPQTYAAASSSKGGAIAGGIVVSAIIGIVVISAVVRALQVGRTSSVQNPTQVSPTTTAAKNPNIEHFPFTIAWNAKVRASTDPSIAVGSPCSLTMRLHSNNVTYVKDNLAFTCGRILYDSSQALSGTSNNDSTLHEYAAPGEVRAFVYSLKANDIGARTGARNQIEVGTKDHSVYAFRDTVPSFHVTATIDELSGERHGLPLFIANIPQFEQIVERTLTVKTKSGSVPFAGATCDMKISPANSTLAKHPELTCRVLVTCAGKVVFGTNTSGYEECVLSKGLPVSFVDATPTSVDNDPELSADLIAGTATLGDVLPNGAKYSVNFAVK
jgi:hypothetical protein